MQVAQAQTKSDFDAIRSLMGDFVQWHYERHHEFIDLIDSYFDKRKFAAELDALPGEFAPPRGRFLIAVNGGEVIGCAALRDLGGGGCEMKRMFVRPGHHGTGAGRALAEGIIAEARKAGYDRMLLDTGPKQVEAQGLYRQLGFKTIAPYYDLDDEMRNWLVFMQLDLTEPMS